MTSSPNRFPVNSRRNYAKIFFRKSRNINGTLIIKDNDMGDFDKDVWEMSLPFNKEGKKITKRLKYIQFTKVNHYHLLNIYLTKPDIPRPISCFFLIGKYFSLVTFCLFRLTIQYTSWTNINVSREIRQFYLTRNM